MYLTPGGLFCDRYLNQEERKGLSEVVLSRRFWVRSAVIVGVIVMLTGVGFSQQLSFRPHPKCPQGTTAAKTQSKLWFNDGAWWGILFDLSS